MRHAKIVCTLGPATNTVDAIRRLIAEGMDVARLNFSHGDHASHKAVFEAVRQASREVGKPIAIMADLSGPKIRLGEMNAGGAEVRPGDPLIINADSKRPLIGNADRVWTTFDDLPKSVAPGASIFADDGQLEFIVEQISGVDVICRVKTGGLLRSRKGLNIPFASLSTPAITEKDKTDLTFGRQLGVDYFALSFVRSPDDVRDAKKLAGDIPVIAKIEKPSAIDHLSEIADLADGLMVARGDLAIEVGAEKVPLLQKRMIREMNRRAKPVITATQMLESMIHSPTPTRAEVSDIANAVLDGADALMLSAESAMGQYPYEAVRTMARVIEEVETTAEQAGMARTLQLGVAPTFDNAVAHAASWAATSLDLKAVVVFSETGRSVALVSAHRPATTIVGFSRHEKVLPRLALFWGVTPVFGDWLHDERAILERAESVLQNQKLASPGDAIAVNFGLDDGLDAGTTIMRLWKIRPQR